MFNIYPILFIIILFSSPYIFESIWTGFINKYEDGIITRVLIPWLIMMVVYWIYGCIFILIDIYKNPKFIYNTKYQNINKNNKNCTISNCIKVVLFNQVFLVLPLFYIMSYYLPLKFNNRVPTLLSLFKQTIAIQLLGELLYYCVHRILHHRLIYKYIHKIHHDFNVPIGIVSLYAHPLEIIFGNILALIGPIFFINCDLYVFYISIVLGFIDSINDHCGYNIKNRDHDIHHEKYIYNYGSIGLFDIIFGTKY